MNKKILKYFIIQRQHLSEDFTDTVETFIGNGYQPYGFPFLTSKGYICQVMVVYEQ